MTMGERIRSRRTELGLSQEELAQQTGYRDKSAISKIELGINDIPVRQLVKLASALCVPVIWIIEGHT